MKSLHRDATLVVKSQFKAEVAILSQFSHLNIVEYLGVFKNGDHVSSITVCYSSEHSTKKLHTALSVNRYEIQCEKLCPNFELFYSLRTCKSCQVDITFTVSIRTAMQYRVLVHS